MPSSTIKTSAYIATSLDGYIARLDGSLDWLPSGNEAGSDGDYGYGAFMSTVDFIVMGRHTFEKVLTFNDWPFPQQRVVVLTNRSQTIPPSLLPVVECQKGSPAEIIARLAERGARHLYIDGGNTIQRFLAAGQLQRLIVTRIPVLLGQGIPLFGPLPQDVRLRHLRTNQFASGLVQSEYEITAAGTASAAPER